MTASRACMRCKANKTKCDLARPRCGRCTRQNTPCIAPADIHGFRSENEVAKRNSQRARMPKGSLPPGDVQTSIDSSLNELHVDWGMLYPWLNARALASVPEPLRRDLESRAVDRFFINWVLHSEQAPGHMTALPALYHTTAADSTLWHAVRAIAFADLRRTSCGGSTASIFSTKARRSYGDALQGIRGLISNGGDLSTDHVLASLLLIDSFETVYLEQPEPLGHHGQAISLILEIRGHKQLFDPSGFSLCSLATHRLLSRQLLRREQPHAFQLQLLELLDHDRPDVRIFHDVYRIAILCAHAHYLLEGRNVVRQEESSVLISSMKELLVEVQAWSTSANPAWLPGSSQSSALETIGTTSPYPAGHPFARFSYMNIMTYPDLWIQFVWTFHEAAQLVLRESLMDVMEHCRIQKISCAATSSDDILSESTAVLNHSGIIMRALPPLLGFAESHRGTKAVSQQGQVATRCLALFSMYVIANARHTNDEHKRTAKAVIQWVHERHALAM